MHAHTAIHFRNPFEEHRQYQSFMSTRLPAPAPQLDMTNVSNTAKFQTRTQEHGNVDGYYGNKISHRQAYAPQQLLNADPGGFDSGQGASSRAMSPIFPTSKLAFGDQSRSQSRKNSQSHSIAPAFQVPRSVNDSGGSLAELAAQITCLFWFESSDILKQVENSPDPIIPPRKLIPEATPSTGFKKFVTTLLSTTMVAQNVVLLALLFIHRLKKLNVGVRGKEGSEFRLLTVALMLGNKFLDDNTYTNKTWAEVSGINVGEVHIMEVEFLSNMKYCLFTSADDWSQWQSLLGKFAAFFERATRVQPAHLPAPILPPASSLNLPMALPSPPVSNQASPPYANELQHGGYPYFASQHGPTPAPSPLAAVSLSNPPTQQGGQLSSRKRSREDYSTEPPAKRAATQSTYGSPLHQASSAMSAQSTVPRLTLPSMSIPPSQSSASTYSAQSHAQLPPLVVPGRAMAMVYPSATSQASTPQPFAASGGATQPHSQVHSAYQSRQHSPYALSAASSPNGNLPQSASILHPPAQISPSYFLQQRNSPYRPIHNVNTLLHPPPSAAMQHRSQNLDYSQMHYQPIGKTTQQRQSGRLPYIAQNIWLEGNQTMTPVSQWKGFQHLSQQPTQAPPSSVSQQQG